MLTIKVLYIHNFYQQSGGEDKVVEKEIDLLRSNGIEVHLYSVHNDTIKDKGISGKLGIALGTTWSIREYKKIKSYLIDVKPNVVHVHNFFPIISPSVYYACASLNIPVVQTLHNYRLICPSATFLRNNSICEDCLEGSILNSIKHGCYRDSKAQTLPVASMIALNKLLGTWNNKVSRFIALTNFAKSKFVKNGLSAEKIVIKPNFSRQRIIEKSIEYNYILFVGRLSIEKGTHHLLKAWQKVKNKRHTKLIIIGDGPEKNHLEKKYNSEDIKFLGKQDELTVLEYMKNAKYLAVPSICYEGFPLTIIEAFSVGTPVICSNIGSLQEVVDNNITGFHYSYNNPEHLEEIIEKALIFEEYEIMRKNTFKKYSDNYSEQVNFKELITVYLEVIEEKKNEIV